MLPLPEQRNPRPVLGTRWARAASVPYSNPMTAPDFIAKWSKVDLTERSAAQQHFLDLCELVGHPKPAAADPTGESFTFEKGASKQGGGDGWADVWEKDFFGWGSLLFASTGPSSCATPESGKDAHLHPGLTLPLSLNCHQFVNNFNTENLVTGCPDF